MCVYNWPALETQSHKMDLKKYQISHDREGLFTTDKLSPKVSPLRRKKTIQIIQNLC